MSTTKIAIFDTRNGTLMHVSAAATPFAALVEFQGICGGFGEQTFEQAAEGLSFHAISDEQAAMPNADIEGLVLPRLVY